MIVSTTRNILVKGEAALKRPIPPTKSIEHNIE